MDIVLSVEEAAEVQAYLRELAGVVEQIGRTSQANDRRPLWVTYDEIQSKIHRLIPPTWDTPADAGPYTAEI